MFDAVSDKTLIKRALRGHADAWEKLIMRHEQNVYNFALRMTGDPDDARDLMQEVFMGVFRNLEKFDFRAAFSTWLYRIAANRAVDFFRRRKPVEPLESERGALDPPSPHDSPLEQTAKSQANRQVMQALKQLPTDQRLTVELKFFHEMTFEEIAEALDASPNTIKTRLYAALRKIRTALPEAAHA